MRRRLGFQTLTKAQREANLAYNLDAMNTTKLPLYSTAARTNFCVSSVDGPGGLKLYFDGNSKITAGNGTYDDPKPNAFSLPSRAIEASHGDPGIHCPDATPTCMASCYVASLADQNAELYGYYRTNFATMQEIIGGPNENAWAQTVADWISANAPHGFRWHVSGDLYSAEYASFVAHVTKLTNPVQHWIYTRSFWLTAVFVGLPNISVNYSVDRDNYSESIKYFAAHQASGSPVRYCYLASGPGDTPELPEGSVIFPDYHLRGGTAEWFNFLPAAKKKMVCPVDLHGKSERRRCGPCSKCIDMPGTL